MSPSVWYLFLIGLAGLISSLFLSFSTVHSYEAWLACDPSLSHLLQASQSKVVERRAPQL